MGGTRLMWRTVNNHSNYEVSNAGEIRNKRTGRILSSFRDKDGYRGVHLNSSGTSYTYKVHRLVTEAFLENDPIRDQVNHKNGDKADNRVSNLEWCTRSENTRHAYENRLFTANIIPAIKAHTKLDANDRRNILRMREEGKLLREIAAFYDVGITTIHSICKGGV